MAQLERRPYVGSCHCGTVKYVAYLKLPATGNGEKTATLTCNHQLTF
jgi:hypothetical protein